MSNTVFALDFEVMNNLSRAIQQAPGLVECKQMDDLFLSAFETGLVLVPVMAGLLLVALPLLGGRRYWWITSLLWRRLGAGIAVSIVAVFTYVGIPKMLLGVFPYGSVDPSYAQCVGRNFGGEGFLDGAIGAGASALGQPAKMTGLLLAGVAVGVFFGWIFEFLVHRFQGLRSEV